MKRVACYVRVSTEEQKKHGLSVDSQIDALKKYCQENSYTVSGVYNDAGISARKSYTRRPALLKLIEDCKSGKIDLIIFTKLDRYFRNVADYYEVQKQLEKCNVPWRAIWEDYETETSSGVFKVNIMLSVAQSEADRTSERIRNVNAYMREKGYYVSGNAPTGYVRANKRLIKDVSCEKAIDAFFNCYSTTKSVAQSCEKAYETGFTISKRLGIDMLKNPAYYGKASGFHDCEPYITKEQFDINSNSLMKFERDCTAPKYVYLFSCMVKCGVCGGSMAGKTSPTKLKDGTKKNKKSYVCSKHRLNPHECDNSQILEKIIENYLLDNLDYELNKYNVEVTAKLKDLNVEKKRSQLQKRLERLAFLFEEGDMDIETYKSKKALIKEELLSLPDSESKIIEPLPENWREVYDKLDDKGKKSFWKNIIDKIYVYKGHRFRVVFK